VREPAADEVPARVARQRVEPQHGGVRRQEQRADADPETPGLGEDASPASYVLISSSAEAR
jgi:hypothetical protein